jgi:hypothetical protein
MRIALPCTRSMLADGALTVLISQQSLLTQLPALTVPVLCLDEAQFDQLSSLNPNVPGLHSRHLAEYMLPVWSIMDRCCPHDRHGVPILVRACSLTCYPSLA